MQDIVIVGAGGFAREVSWLIKEINKEKLKWNIIGFIDDKKSLLNTYIDGYKVVGNIEWLKKQKVNVVVAIGNPHTRKKIINELKNSENVYATLIHPNLIWSNFVEIGEGSIICANNIMTVDIVVGKHVIVNINCTIGHDVVVKDYATILPGANISGNVNIGECVNVGTGTSIIQGINIGDNITLGAGAVVVKDIVDKGTYVGVPVKKLNN